MANENHILLSFCIPTYNRPNELERMLLGVAPQLEKHKDEIEVIVKDDNSNDISELIAKKILTEHNLEYKIIRGEKKGIDPAVVELAEEARGEYLWWFSDDDELLPGAIDRVMDSIDEFNPNSIFLNFQSVHCSKPSIPVREDTVYRNYSDFMSAAGPHLTLLSIYFRLCAVTVVTN